jgi:hypothetical protein
MLHSHLFDCRVNNLERDELWRQLANAVAVRSIRDQVLWTQSAIFWAANAVFLSAFFQGGEFPKSKPMGLVITLAAFAVAAAWSVLQSRLIAFLRVDEVLIHRLEERLNIEQDLALSPGHNKTSYQDHLSQGISAKRLLKASAFAAVVVWSLALIWVLAEVPPPEATKRAVPNLSSPRMTNPTTPNPSFQGTLRDKAAQRP